MLKAFSKVFHKSVSSPEEQSKHGPTNTQVVGAHQSTAQQTTKKTSDAHQTAGFLVDSAVSRGGDGIGLSTPCRNAGDGGQGRPYAQEANARHTSEAFGRAPTQQHVQPRLHMKPPAQGVDGRLPLTNDNLEWHLRMIPPMKESKYDRIMRYVQEQQQNVAAAADLAMQQQSRDIDSSMLMGGQVCCEYGVPIPGMEYMDPSYNSIDHQMAAHQQQYYQQQQQLVHTSIGARPSYTIPLGIPNATSPGANSAHTHALDVGKREIVPSSHAFRPMGNIGSNPSQHQMQSHAGFGIVPPPVNHSNTNNTAASGQRDADLQLAARNAHEEDDNMPLAALNIGASPCQQNTLLEVQPESLNILAGSSLEKYMKGPLDEPLPALVSPMNHGVRMSMMSFGSNMAVQMNSDMHALSRSHSLSNLQSNSVYGSQYRNTPIARSPTIHDIGAQHMSAHSGSAQQPSFLSVQINKRQSMDAVAAYARDRGLSHARSDGYGQPPATLAALGISMNNATDVLGADAIVENVGAGDADDTGKSDANDDDDDAPLMLPTKQQALKADTHYILDSVSSVALRVVNQTDSCRESDQSADEKDSGNRQNQQADRLGALDEIKNEADEDDNQPLMQLSRKLSGPRPSSSSPAMRPPQLFVNTTAQVQKAGRNEDDDDLPLSGLLLNPNSADDELGNLPLPMPRRLADPDAVANMDEMINESAAPLRLSIGDCPESPIALPRGAVRKHSLLLHSSGPGGVRSRNKGSERAPTEQNTAEKPLLSRRPAALNIQPVILSKRQSKISAFAQGMPIAEADAISESGSGSNNGSKSIDNCPISANATAIRRDNGWRKMTDEFVVSEEVGRPWAMQQPYSPSISSQNSARRTQRGSTLGQKLTDELQQLREGLSRSRWNDKAERKSWQLGDDMPPVKQPWLQHHEKTLSDPALSSSVVGENAIGMAAGHTLGAAYLNDGELLQPSSWSHPDKQRPMSTQYHQVSRWFSKGSGANDGGGNSRTQHVEQQRPSKDDTERVSTSPQSSNSLSLSSRLNKHLEKLKRSFKPASGAV
ncbi:hypothetical protein LPJ66_002461 [Kickxella alabastrina]|uniref:Uncharacterized protein n=1 Tax=Kickxella alabastrina TaxID=61397 RepID=A0ACC1IQD6_9FUNG|nr:hypothetical protein LPJ66_002461 [Kickxella alabastrina]